MSEQKNKYVKKFKRIIKGKKERKKIMKKLLCLFLTLTMVLSLGCVAVFADSDYTEIRLANTDTMAYFEQSITLKVEGYNGTEWETIPNSKVKFSALSRFVEISADGVAKLNSDFTKEFNKGASDGKSLSSPVTAVYEKADGTTLTKKVLLMFGSATLKNAYSNSGEQTCNTVVEGVPGLTGEKVFSSSARITEYLNQYSTESFYEGWFYDPGDSQVGGAIGFANHAQGNHNFYIYLRVGSATKYYLSDGSADSAGGFNGNDTTGGKEVATRSKGWHQFALDLVSGKKVKAYVDGELVYQRELASIPSNGDMKILRICAGGNIYYDRIRLMRSKTVPENNPTINYAKVSGTVANNSTIKADYEVIFPNSHTKATSLVQWQSAESYEKAKAGEFTDIDGATGDSFTVTDATKFYRYAVTPKSQYNGETKSGTLYYSDYTAGPLAPEAKNVTLSGINFKGATLTVDYDYFDINDDEYDYTEYVWYACDTAEGVNGTHTVIGGATDKDYVVAEEYADKYIQASVKPYAKAEPKSGETVYSNVLSPFKKPVAKDVKITGEYGVGKTLVGSYTYESDAEEDKDKTTLTWYRKKGDVWENAKAPSNANDQYADKYTLSTADIDCEIYFGVKPVCKDNSNALSESDLTGVEVKSTAFVGAVKPTGANPRIEGTIKAGNTVTVNYDYSHSMNIEEGNTQYRIYVGGELKSSTKTLYLTADMAGKQIYATILPTAVEEPAQGDMLTTGIATVGYTIQTAITVPSGGSSGGGGSYSVTETAESKALKTVKKAIVLLVNSGKALVEGANKNVDSDTAVAPFIENSRTLLPLRFIAESLGAKVDWNNETREIKITYGSTTVIMHLDSDIYYINGIEHKMDVTAKSVSGRTMIPVRYISESLGKEVFWDDKGLIVISDKTNIFDSQKDSAMIDALIGKLK